jgi:hypothetical protein
MLRSPLRLVVVAIAAAVAVLVVPRTGLARAADVPAPEPVCSISDERLAELSGLAADGEHYYAVNDGGTQVEVVVLGTDCGVQRVITAPTDPYDVEDLALAADGTLWLADTGDNSKRRDTVALHAVTGDGASTLYRLTYPDGQHDAEALLLDSSGTPYIITKDVLGEAEVYRPVSELSSPGPTALEHVGSLEFDTTDTSGGPVGRIGSLLVTGAATGHDGNVVALRTYTDAYLYPVPNGDVLAALRTNPVRVPLPGEPQGEAIAFTPDGRLLSAGEGLGEPIRAITGAVDLASQPEQTAADGPTGSGAAAPAADAAGPGGQQQGRSGEQDRSAGLPFVPAMVVALLVAVTAFYGLRRLRR